MSTTDLQSNARAAQTAKPHKGIAMEGLIARWYTKVRKHDPELKKDLSLIDNSIPAGSEILEVAPGPGTLAIELARLGKYQVTGMDISKTFVQIAQAKAEEAGVAAKFYHGNASEMPFEAEAFDFIVCRAAFKNFTAPVQALREMYRVLRPGGKALIQDLRRDASSEDIEITVKDLRLNWINALLTRWTFKHFLLKNAYTKADIQQMVAQTDFVHADIREETVSLAIWLEK